MPYKCPEKARESAKLRQRKYREKNKEKLNLINLGRYHKKYKKDEEYLAYRKKYLAEWKEENKQYQRNYMARNPDQREKNRKRALEWQKKNPGKIRARNSFRRKKVKAATPKWVDKKEIVNIYVQAAEMQKKEGKEYHVDHIVPITNELVCGLHVPWNLQIIPAQDNLSKGNNFKP